MDARQRQWFLRYEKVAHERGGKLLSRAYVNAGTPLRWRCEHGHTWEAIPNSIARGSWCGRCAGVAPLTLADLHAIARAHGGACLATQYKNLAEPVAWRCAEGHEWTSHARHMRALGTWCPRCSGRKTLDDLRALAKDNDGVLLSTKAQGAHDKYEWQCKLGHVFSATRASVDLAGTWCPTCRKAARGTLSRMQHIAKKRGGKCESKKYVASTEPLDFICKERHAFSMTPAAVLNHWCPECGKGVGRSRPKLGIEDLRETAQARGGKCLSEEYAGVRAFYDWQCARGHTWRAIGQAIRAGGWCRACAHAIVGTIDGFRAYAVAQGGECLSTDYEGQRTLLGFRCARRHRFELMGLAVKTGVWCPRCSSG